MQNALVEYRGVRVTALDVQLRLRLRPVYFRPMDHIANDFGHADLSNRFRTVSANHQRALVTDGCNCPVFPGCWYILIVVILNSNHYPEPFTLLKPLYKILNASREFPGQLVFRYIWGRFSLEDLVGLNRR